MSKLLWLLFFPALLFAKPKGANVESGTAKVRSIGSVMEVQASDRTIIHWDEFSIDTGETMRFVQPGVDSAVLNRVMNGMSQIDGQLLANGRVYLLNPNGIIIGKEGVVQAASFIASTLNFDNEDFFKNREILFKGNSQEYIVNLGKIEAIGGDVFLISRGIVNDGQITAAEGVVGIAAGGEILLKPSGLHRLFIAPQQEVQTEEIQGNAYSYAMNRSGTIEAGGTKEENGRIFLIADRGTAVNSGTMVAKGGTVHLLGDQVGVLEKGKIDVSGDHGGGEVLIGGDFQGKNDQVQNARMNAVMEGAEIYADALESGDGGRVIIWSDETTVMKGAVFARGGKQSGDGGFVEASGKETLCFSGLVDATAPFGKMGELLLDPSNVTISLAATLDILFNPTTGIFAPVSQTANLSNVAGALNLQDALNAGTVNITVITTSGSTEAGNISLTAPVLWGSASSLTLQAEGNITQTDSLASTASGSVIFEAGGNITIGSTIDVVSGNISLTGRNITTTGSLIGTTSGSAVFEAEENITIQSGIEMVSGNISLTAGGTIAFFPPTVREISTVSGNISFSAGEDIVLGGIALGGNIGVIAGNGAITMESGRDLQLIGSSTASAFARVDTRGFPNTFTVGRDLILEAGASGDSFVQIGTTGVVNPSRLDFTVGRDVKVLGGVGADSYALIGFARGVGAGIRTIAADINFDNVGGDIQVVSGSGTDAFAQIGIENGNTADAGSIVVQSNVIFDQVGGDILVQAGTSSAMIGHGNPITLGADVYQGSVMIDPAGDVEILASASASAGIGFLPGGTGISVVSPEVKVSSRSLTLTANDGTDAFVGFYSSDPAFDNAVTILEVNVQTRDNLILNPGLIDSFTFDGSAAIGAFTQTGTATAGNVNIQSGNFYLNGSSGATGSFSRVLGNNISILSAGMSIGHGGSNAQSAEISGSNSVLAISDLDITLNQDSLVHSMSGDVILVVDNKDPKSPDIGNGQFVIRSGALLTAGSALRIFTAKRSQNTILAPLNGAAFVPGAFLINSSTEQWGEYFPDNFGGDPFTIFYKLAIPIEAFNQYGRVIGEMFQNLKTYDDFLFCCQYFLYGYDKDCYDQTFHPRGMVSSFDLFGEEVKQMLRPKYRNYHTKYVESF